MKFRKIYHRQKYLNKIRPFFNSDIIKVITGIRRCGKSCIMLACIEELQSNGINKENIIYIPLDNRGYKTIKTPAQLEEAIENKVNDSSEKLYIFIDEIQNVKDFEPVVQAYAEEGHSIFITGSNSYLLSEEITTKLTGRYVSFEIMPLDYCEYIDMKKFLNLQVNNDKYTEFTEFILNGGFPKTLEFNEASAKRLYCESIIHEIFDKDIRIRQKINNVDLFNRIRQYVINNYSSPLSPKNIADELALIGINTKQATISKYIQDLINAKIIYECDSFDLKSKKSLVRSKKYYIADTSLYFATNTNNSLNYGPTLENLVFTYLVGCGYKVSTGKIGNFECDFIVRNNSGEYVYIQVCYTLQGSDIAETNKIKEREYRPFRKIPDSFPRYIISLDRFLDQQEGVHHINAIDFFLGKEKIFK